MKKYNIPADRFIISTIGRLERNKGHETVIKSLKFLPENIIYVVVGGGFMRERFEQLAKKEKASNRLFFTGRVPENELVDFYNIADIVVLLSVFGKDEGEGLPLGLIEASACEKPIICGNEDGSLDAVSKENPNGFIINPKEADKLANIVKQYFDNPDLGQEHGKNGRKYVMNNFKFDIFKERLKKIIWDT